MSEANNDIAIQFKLQRDMAWAEIDRLNCARIQEIAASHQSNMESLLEVARERDAVTAELARVTKELERAKEQIVQGKKLYDLTLNNELRWMRKHEEIEQQNLTLKAENTELRADRERLNKNITTICDAAESMWGYGTDLRNGTHAMLLRAAIDAAREGQKSPEDAQGGAR